MRMMVFFDLPVLTAAQRKAYAKFRKFLVKSGFLMAQESVYTKLLLNSTAADNLKSNIRANKPKEGLVQILLVTEKQYSRMEMIVGEATNEIVNSADRLVIL